ncbi:hypothetical protein GCM10011515_06180 [Tsuneonella deserti]|uniref:Outer membrane protein beta-barrel domain-containing protein n=1 Tax=Tsuneonella deserti TaxID=2035528 RepID=A0ABQ1S1B0_9SPHN|nr:outer membrane beta-barrel protein [Tsuneonella deserti]GGD89265.1 hypothetical protein GCM10011515_06180 [Tsuneonella deserti]
MQRLTFSLALALVGLAAPACASDADEYDFEGPRAAILTGFDATELPNDDGPEFMYALEAGFDWRAGPWVLGLAASIGGTDAGKTEYGVAAPGDSVTVHYGRDVYAGFRAGRVLGRRFLAFGRGGVALTEMRSAYKADSRSPEPAQVPDPRRVPKFARPGTLVGFWTGAGIEYQLGRKLYALGEYRYANFHDGIYRHQGAVGLGVRF